MSVVVRALNPACTRTGPCLSPGFKKQLVKAHGDREVADENLQRGSFLAFGDQAQEPGLCPQKWREAPIQVQVTPQVAPGAQQCRDSRGAFSPSRGSTLNLPALAAPELRVTECSLKQPIDS